MKWSIRTGHDVLNILTWDIPQSEYRTSSINY
jgi:hypothetical protein